ncbi:S9 family peptidase [Microbacterium sp. MPKO10]|uniref:S9 family peptidase n=1 Tax=Microbacterium sp. MPKO10 TaxID=2989818 RepID=UPI0022366038|nr:S9 family peptidase [Microbacterium sp. MPKO10]MCW4458304.1 S9 family peptidase [Microbacterium sp. MPKO10]
MTDAPRAPRRDFARTHHGDTVNDPYHWLSDKDDPAVTDYLNRENAYADSATAHLAPLRQTLFDEIKAHTQETDLSVPVREGAWWYYSRTFEGKQYAAHVRAPAADWTPPDTESGDVDGEEVVLDDNIEADGHDFYRLGSFDISRDGTRMLYAIDAVGDERYTLRIRDLTTGANLADHVPGTFSGAVFSPDGEWVFYTTVDDTWRPDTVWRHRVGTAAAEDQRVFHEPDDRYWAGVGVTRSGRYIVIAVGSNITSEWMLIDADAPESEPRVIWQRREGVEYEVEHAVIGGRSVLLILHNAAAENFELVAIDADALGDPDAAVTVLPHDDAVRLESVEAFRDRLALEYREGGLTRIATIELDASSTLENLSVAPVVFDESLYTVGFGGNPEWEQPTLRLSYTSFVTPSTVYALDPASQSLTLLKQQPVLGGYDPENYEQSREWATARDGERIPLSIVRRRGAASGPLLMFGYGAYEHSMNPGFSIARLSLLDRGVTFAIAHVRGGGDLGRRWYEDGKLLNKKNSFTDFVDSAQHLVDAGHTTPDRLVAEGGSAGGLLMGAMLNLAPELFAGVHAAVPFVDALTTILNPELPLTVIEWDEWGDPLHDSDVYAYMKSYSPYENVRDDVAYPRILATTSLNDTRVFYAEPAKWVARLRDVEAPALLRTEMHAGHGGVSGRYAAWRERAWEMAWILDVLGCADVTVAH